MLNHSIMTRIPVYQEDMASRVSAHPIPELQKYVWHNLMGQKGENGQAELHWQCQHSPLSDQQDWWRASQQSYKCPKIPSGGSSRHWTEVTLLSMHMEYSPGETRVSWAIKPEKEQNKFKAHRSKEIKQEEKSMNWKTEGGRNTDETKARSLKRSIELIIV